MADALDIAILAPTSPQQGVVLARWGSDMAIEPLPAGALRGLERFRQRIIGALSRREERPQPSELTAFGRELFSFLFHGELARLYAKVPPAHTRIQIVSKSNELQVLPWEYLQDPSFVAGPWRQRSVVRIVPTIGQPDPEPVKLAGGLRILFVAAEPADQEPVSWEEERERIESVFRARLPSQKIHLEVVEGADFAALQKTIMDEDFDVLHFSGHGTVSKGAGHLVFTSRSTGGTDLVSAQDLGLLLSGRSIRLVVLSACETAAGSFDEPFSVIAETLVATGIPAVVANQFAVPDATVAPFVAALYGELLRSGDIDLAVTDGRVALNAHLRGSPFAVLEWGIPTLYRHVGAAKVFQ